MHKRHHDPRWELIKRAGEADMKDALGHGSDSRGGSALEKRNAMERKRENFAAANRQKDAQVGRDIRGWLGVTSGGPKGGPGTVAMKRAASVLAGGHPKSAPVPTHPHMTRRYGGYRPDPAAGFEKFK